MKRDLPYQAGTRLTQSLSARLTQFHGRVRRLLDTKSVSHTLSCLLLLIGGVLLVYCGGLYIQDAYGSYAARGDTDVPAPVAISAPAEEEPAPFTAPVLNVSLGSTSEGRVFGAVPDSAQAAKTPTVTRVAIPSIGVDSKVVEVGWDVVQQGEQQVSVWQVAKYAVGQQRGSANPGEGGNVVLAGHVGGYGKVFKDLFYVKPGDQITLYSNGQQYLYTVQKRLLVTEEGVSPEQHAANNQLIEPTDREMVTMVTCWPDKGRDKFTQRVVVQAVPFANTAAPTNGQSRWTIR